MFLATNIPFFAISDRTSLLLPQRTSPKSMLLFFLRFLRMKSRFEVEAFNSQKEAIMNGLRKPYLEVKVSRLDMF